jgi:hypothetical protein
MTGIQRAGRVRTRIAAGAAAVAAVLLLASSAPAMAGLGTPGAATAPRVISGDAGYAVTGKHLGTVETWVTLPRAARFARELGRVGVTLQLWTARTVLDLKVVACTDVTCRPGGRPATRYYRPVFSAYDRTTRALICSTAATGSLRCPTARSWTRLRLAPGGILSFYLAYPIPYDEVLMGVSEGASGDAIGYQVPATSSGAPGQDYAQARLGVELGASPWAAVPFRAPRAAVAIATFDRPVPPPYAAEVANLKGKAGGIAAPWWGHHEVRATAAGTAAKTAAKPGSLWDDGYGFTVYLEP